MSRTVIIPDIHNRFAVAEAIISSEKPDKVVFLGDYFDSYWDNLDMAYQTALWLKESMKDPNRIHLLGNHDLSYLDRNFACAGYSEAKLFWISKAKVDLSKLKLYTWIDDKWLCTHAGLSYDFFKAYANDFDTVDSFLETHVIDPGLKVRLYDCSRFRGGWNAFGGIIWCDYDEFKDIPDTKQIFGHTVGGVRHKKNDDGSEHFCIDTYLENYGIYENGEMVIGSSSPQR